MLMTQMKERSIQTLGYLPVGDGDFPHQKKLLQGLMDSVEVGSVLSRCSALPLNWKNYSGRFFFFCNFLRNNNPKLLRETSLSDCG